MDVSAGFKRKHLRVSGLFLFLILEISIKRLVLPILLVCVVSKPVLTTAYLVLK